MKKTKPFQLVMLSTQKATKTCKTLVHFLVYEQKLILVEENNNPLVKPYHLYIISDEKIKKGDWAIKEAFMTSSGIPELHQINNHDLEAINDSTFWKKIVASTDETITPRAIIPTSFLKVYIASYNNNSPIKEVHLEMEASYHEEEICDGGLVIKKRSDKTVIIHQSKTFGESEVKELILEALLEFAPTLNQESVQSWLIDKFKK